MKAKPTLPHPSSTGKVRTDTPEPQAGHQNISQQLRRMPAPPVRITKTMTLPPDPYVKPSSNKVPAAPTYLRFSVTLTHPTADDRQVTLYTTRHLRVGDWVQVGKLQLQITIIEPAATNRLQMGDTVIL